MMLNDAMQEAVNEQINNELFAMYSYLSMSAYCEHKQFRGCAHWMRMQSDEERIHALRLYDFLKAFEQEQKVTAQINGLYEMAFNEKAFAALVELEWFINEQVEEEKTA